jgi:hypothetical protein
MKAVEETRGAVVEARETWRMMVDLNMMMMVVVVMMMMID